MPAVKEQNLNLVPEGFIGPKEAAALLGCRVSFLNNRRWVRRHGLPAMQLRRGWPIYYDKAKLSEWLAHRHRTLDPEQRHDGPKQARKKKRAHNGS